MSKTQLKGSELKEASISEFFEKNKHILGFDSLQKSLFMIVKEAIDNSLDACEEYGIVPEIAVRVSKIGADVYEAQIEDNGPGIDRKEVPRVFGQLLYGSRFHSIRQSRGQQGIGITAAILYGQITTGKTATVKSKKMGEDVAVEIELGINVKENKADVKGEKAVIWDTDHGTSVTVRAKGKYQAGRQSVFEYLKESAVVNPNMNLTYIDPDNRKWTFRRVVDQPSPKSKEIKPHPLGLELGEIRSIAQTSNEKTLAKFLSGEFNRVSEKVAGEILQVSGIDGSKPPSELTLEEIDSLMKAFKEVRMMPPPTDCLSPIGGEFLRKGLRNIYEETHPSFYSKPVMRPVAVYSGNPFSVEASIVYGGELKSDEQVRVVRYANKVPLLYQAGACAITKAISEMDWRPYGLEQRQGSGVPYGPMIILVHVYGTRIPYTSESKEAVANVEDIVEEVKLAMRSLGRGVRKYLRKQQKRVKAREKFRLVQILLPEIGRKSSSILGETEPSLDLVLSQIANVVFVNEDTEPFENGIHVRISLHNFTSRPRSLTVYADPPVGEISGGVNTWEVKEINPAENYSITYDVIGSIKDYPGTDIYFTGIDAVYVQGAEPLPADWNMESLTIEEEDGGDEEEEEDSDEL